MAYIKTTWTNDETKLSAANLNNMEAGIELCDILSIQNKDRLDDLYNALIEKLTITYSGENNQFVFAIGDENNDEFVVEKIVTIDTHGNQIDQIEEDLDSLEENIETHKGRTDNPHSVTKAQVGLGNVDNTSDADKPISDATQEALNDKIKNVSFSYNDNAVKLIKTKTNAPGTEELLHLADSTGAGLMSKETVAAIQQMRSELDIIENANVRLMYQVKDNPTKLEIENFVKAQGYTDTSKWPNIGVKIKATNHIWTYTSNDGWSDDGTDTVNQASQSLHGVVKGAEEDGKVYIEDDGTMSVVGHDALKTRMTNVENGKQDVPIVKDYVIDPSEFDENQNFICDLLEDKGVEIHEHDLITVYADPEVFSKYRLSYKKGNTINQVKLHVMVLPEEDLVVSISIVRIGEPNNA